MSLRRNNTHLARTDICHLPFAIGSCAYYPRRISRGALVGTEPDVSKGIMRARAANSFPCLLRRAVPSGSPRAARTTWIYLQQAMKPTPTSFSTTVVSPPRALLQTSCTPGRRALHARVVGVDSRRSPHKTHCTCRALLPDWRSLSCRAMRNSPTKLSTVHQGHERNCWKCNSPISSRAFFCSCGAPQPLGEKRADYFEMFDCSPSVFLDVKELEKKFKNMQRAFHPVSQC